jgi:hypothetical protein
MASCNPTRVALRYVLVCAMFAWPSASPLASICFPCLTVAENRNACSPSGLKLKCQECGHFAHVRRGQSQILRRPRF